MILLRRREKGASIRGRKKCIRGGSPKMVEE